MTMIYYHLDKSGLIDENFNNYKNSNFLLIGPKSLNGFSAGFVKAKLGCSLFNYISLELYYKIKHFFETRDTSQITIIINELYANNYLFSEVYIQRLLREIVFEYVRLNLFYDKPSRLSCIFLIDSEKELTIWKRYLSSNNYALYHFEKIDPKSYNININEVWHKADSRYLEVDCSDINKISNNAVLYWSGILSEKSVTEILFLGVLKEIKKLPITSCHTP